MKPLLAFLLLCFWSLPAMAIEESDAPNRTLADYIADYVDVPEGATDWKIFGQTKEISIDTVAPDGLQLQYFKPAFTPEVEDLNGRIIKVKGFMFPLEATEGQKLFLFGPFPVNCPFQYHVGPSLVIEVHAPKPIAFTYDPLVLEGRLELVRDDPDTGVFYRLKIARAFSG
jgi:hypothetical protein